MPVRPFYFIIYLSILILSGCKKDDADENYGGTTFRKRGDFFLRNDFANPKVGGQLVYFYPCFYFNFNAPTKYMVGIQGRNEYLNHNITIEFSQVKIQESGPSSFLLIEDKFATAKEDSDRVLITINGQSDLADLIMTEDELIFRSYSNNVINTKGQISLNRIKPNMVWGYLVFKDSSFMYIGSKFIDSLISSGAAKRTNYRPGNYSAFTVNNDSTAGLVFDMNDNSPLGITMPFLIESTSDFTTIRLIAERFVYDINDPNGVKIFLRDAKNNNRLITYYL